MFLYDLLNGFIDSEDLLCMISFNIFNHCLRISNLFHVCFYENNHSYAYFFPRALSLTNHIADNIDFFLYIS